MLKVIAVKIDINLNIDKYLDIFSLIEKQKIFSYKFIQDRLLAFTSELLKKYYLAKILNVNPAELEIGFGTHNKPYVKQPHNKYFNISHSGLYVILAIADHNVGVDIEIGDKLQLNELNDIANIVYNKSEQILISNSKDKFLRLWAKKEALMKCSGVGFVDNQYQQTNMNLDEYQEINNFHIYSSKIFTNYYFGLCIKR